MRGKVKYVKRSVWYATDFDSVRYGHESRYTNTYAVLYNGDEVDIDEDDIRDFYDRSHITKDLIRELSDDLHNVWIEYDEEYSLDGNLEDYI